jgi:hypothetical protein
MNLTIPKRAQNSTSSSSHFLRGSSSVQSSKAERKRYVFSMTAGLLVIATLAVSSVGGMLHTASARDNFASRSFTYTPNDRTKNQVVHQSTVSQPVTTTPDRTTTVVAAPPPAPVTHAQTAPQPVLQPAAQPVDTAPAIATMTVAQSNKGAQPIQYTSSRLADDTRNRILLLAGVAAITGMLLYMISLIGTAKPSVKRDIPIRYIVPVREAMTQ